MNPEISVCICTFKRPELLAELLTALERQRSDTPAFEVIVVDNDAHGSARPVVEEFAARGGLSPVYVCEPEQNISLARNRAVAAARGDWLALIDDDEEPVEHWLVSLRTTARSYDADVVLGPVTPRFPRSAPQWLIDGRFYERPRHATGTHVPYMDVRTSNLLMSREALQAVPGPFDPGLGLSGGEDVMLLERVRALGYRLVWCDEAVVVETVPPDRLRARWLLKRSYRGAQNYAHVHQVLGRSRAIRLSRSISVALRAVGISIVAVIMMLLSLPFGRARTLFWGRKLFAQFGKLTGLVGSRYEEYA